MTLFWYNISILNTTLWWGVIIISNINKILFLLLLCVNVTYASYADLAKLAGISVYKMNKIVSKIIKVETSTGRYDVCNTRSGAYGKYQIMPRTAVWYAKKLSIPLNEWKKPKNQDRMFRAILKDNIRNLRKNRYPITAFTIYGAHQQGFNGFVNITKKRHMSKYTERNMRHNLPSKYKNVNKRILRLVWILYWKRKIGRV